MKTLGFRNRTPLCTGCEVDEEQYDDVEDDGASDPSTESFFLFFSFLVVVLVDVEVGFEGGGMEVVWMESAAAGGSGLWVGEWRGSREGGGASIGG